MKKLFKEADEVLGFNLSKLILEGPKDELDLTTQYSTSNFFDQFFNF